MTAEPALELVDTNVLVYLHDGSAGKKQAQAIELVDRLWDEHVGALSIQVCQEFYVTITRKVPKPLSPAVARDFLATLAAWHVHRPDIDDVLAATDLQQRYQVSFWDAMILRSARALGCSTVWSEDLNAGQSYDGVVVRNPFGGG
ncbi:MAG: PIN domain-containing protein [Acidobacteria bacterium]|nr:PIN domain-containing protein [Acidobacteriota bacterium]